MVCMTVKYFSCNRPGWESCMLKGNVLTDKVTLSNGSIIAGFVRPSPKGKPLQECLSL